MSVQMKIPSVPLELADPVFCCEQRACVRPAEVHCVRMERRMMRGMIGSRNDGDNVPENMARESLKWTLDLSEALRPAHQ